MAEMRILDHTGDTKIIWDSRNEDETKAARDTFDDLRRKGYIGYSVRKNGDKKKVIREFDPEAEKLILVPAMRGG